MPIKILIPTPLRPYAGKQSSVEVTAQTVGEALNTLVTQHPDLRKHLFAEDGKLRSFVKRRYAGQRDGHNHHCALSCRRCITRIGFSRSRI
jgi:molybdopterin converting factor small subunit